MDLTKITLDEFLCHTTEDIPASPDAFSAAAGSFDDLVGRLIRALGGGYEIHQMDEQPGDVLLLHNGAVVGFYVGDTIAIASGHMRKSLSTPLILEAVKNRLLPDRRTLSEAGRGALTKAWMVANGCIQNPWP